MTTRAFCRQTVGIAIGARGRGRGEGLKPRKRESAVIARWLSLTRTTVDILNCLCQGWLW